MLKKRMLTSWHWGEPVAVLKGFEVSVSVSVLNLKLLPCLNCTLWFVFRVDLWNASNLKFGDEFLGGVRVPLRVLGQAGVHDAWWEECHLLSHTLSIILGLFYDFFPTEQGLYCTVLGMGGFDFIIIVNWRSEYVLPQQYRINTDNRPLKVVFNQGRFRMRFEHECSFSTLLTQQSLFLYFIYLGKLKTSPPWMIGAVLWKSEQEFKGIKIGYSVQYNSLWNNPPLTFNENMFSDTIV